MTEEEVPTRGATCLSLRGVGQKDLQLPTQSVGEGPICHFFLLFFSVGKGSGGMHAVLKLCLSYSQLD